MAWGHSALGQPHAFPRGRMPVCMGLCVGGFCVPGSPRACGGLVAQSPVHRGSVPSPCEWVPIGAGLRAGSGGGTGAGPTGLPRGPPVDHASTTPPLMYWTGDVRKGGGGWGWVGLGQGLIRTSGTTDVALPCASQLVRPVHGCPVSRPTGLMTVPRHTHNRMLTVSPHPPSGTPPNEAPSIIPVPWEGGGGIRRPTSSWCPRRWAVCR